MRKVNEIPFNQRISATIAESCQASGLSRATLYRLMKDNKVESTKVGKCRLIIVRSLEKLIDPTAQRAA